MLYRAIDYIPRSFDPAIINPATALTLPLQAAFYAPPSSSMSIPAKIKQMMVSDVFHYDPYLRLLHWKDTSDPGLLVWKRAPPTIYKGLITGNFKLQHYFVPLCRPASFIDTNISFAPFVNCLSLDVSLTAAKSKVSAKLFRSAFQSTQIAPESLRKVSATSWKYFWSLSLTVVQRNVIYRLINGCIPNRSFLHLVMPTVFDSPLCPVCVLSRDSSSHLLFHCPSKEKVWQGVIFEFLWPTTSIGDIKEAFLSLDFSHLWYCQVKGIDSYKILLISLSQIWLAHMRFVFNQVPISHAAILASIRINIQKMIDEDQCLSLL
ncbi:hypothetical protein INT46_009582 [Mucor plumbeus]|uniref:Reverse transcriptase zinc-binding domain-containing protein n=1 Tax=Mucor plumbeus TaxID=97098 RepID=A0A8H7QX71_9FUNG|nr:hypothetical protein INT46_009582 [Mucor plumbeus]